MPGVGEKVCPMTKPIGPLDGERSVYRKTGNVSATKPDPLWQEWVDSHR